MGENKLARNRCQLRYKSLAKMDIFENRYYRLNRSMLSCLGQWPLQSRKNQYLFRTTSVIMIGSILVPKIIKFVEVLGDLRGMVECIPGLGTDFISISKIINCIINAKKMEMLVNQIQHSWAVRTADFETDILRRYAERGRAMTNLYTGYLSSALVVYMLLPLTPVLLDITSPLNETRLRIYPYATEYFLEENEKFFLVWIHAVVAMPFSIGMLMAYDSMFTVHVHHVCSIFAMLGVRLENIGKEKNNEKLPIADNPATNKDKSYEDIVKCIKIHNEAIDCSTLLESSGSVCYFLILCMSLITTTATGITTVMSLDQPGEAMRLGLVTCSVVIHLFYLCWQGHILVQHSEGIFESAYNVSWFDLSPRAKKLLILIMVRSLKPCRLTAGKLFVLSMEYFATALKASMSYFTVFMSVQ